ncbi:50S ribosomal protein L15 [Nitrospirota bacterium]
MKVQDIKPAIGSNRNKKRVGRGPGSGHGKTSCRGHKGQNSRSGGGVRPGFEGGQMPLQRRLPKRGFTSPNKVEYAILNLSDLESMGLDEVTPEKLIEEGVINNIRDGLKILGMGELTRSVKVKADAFSATAMKKIQAAGGTAEVI